MIASLRTLDPHTQINLKQEEITVSTKRKGDLIRRIQKMEATLEKLKRELKEEHGKKIARSYRIDPITIHRLQTSSKNNLIAIEIKRPMSASEALALWSKSEGLVLGNFSELPSDRLLNSDDIDEIFSSPPCKTTSWTDDEDVHFMTGTIAPVNGGRSAHLIRQVSDKLTIKSSFYPKSNLRLGTGTMIVLKAVA